MCRRLGHKRATCDADVAVVDPAQRGLSFVVQVFFEREDLQALGDFIEQIEAEPQVSQCYSVSGECDFWLMAHAATPEAFETWAHRVLMANPHIRRYSTSLVWSRPIFRPAGLAGC
jgi:Lrp/AsnC family transcriptional regulator, leucine-responsive regulatory protein